MSNEGSWELDRSTMQVKHSSGLCLQIEGRISEPSAVVPVSVPKDTSPHLLASLIRQGTEFCRQYQTAKKSAESAAPSRNQSVPHKPKRSVLSLKKA